MKVNIEHINQIICNVAEEEIMPRFRALTCDDIIEKTPGDLVTTADIEAEKKLTSRLQDYLIGSQVLGEEAAHENPAALDILQSDHPVWIIDPVDGTKNFANGRDIFGCIVSLVYRNETLAGWIHDPARSRTAMCELGSGSYMDGEQLLSSNPEPALENMTVSLNPAHKKWLEQCSKDGQTAMPQIATRFGSVAHDYISLAAGDFDCAQYRRLKPWDHAAGVLLFEEAGGYHQMIAAQTPYEPIIYQEDCLLLTASEEIWEEARAFLNPGTDTFKK